MPNFQICGWCMLCEFYEGNKNVTMFFIRKFLLNYPYGLILHLKELRNGASKKKRRFSGHIHEKPSQPQTYIYL
uniref:Uncharacterized protein n=1 Tax=Anguilla anguilla TaxID=7936 RepID=A0A0E9WL89_ANGAN